jgi:TolB-like protein
MSLRPILNAAFGPFRLDFARKALYRGDTLVPLGARAMDVLCTLVETAGNLVTKDELMERVWPGIAVEENNIQVQIWSLRKALGTDEAGADYIVTVPGRGYRFAGKIATADVGKRAASRPFPSLPDRPSIAVLPFANIGGNVDQEYFADGIVEDVITALSRMRWLFVIARNSSFTYKGKATDIREVGRELGVRYVLEGSIRKSADRLRIVGQLIDAATGAHVWADNFDGPVADIFELQDQFVQRVVGSIARQLERAEIERARRKIENLDAYDYYLRGLAYAHAGNKPDNDKALELFEKAIALDPGFAAAYGMAAWCHTMRKERGIMVDPAHEAAETRRLAWRAIELGPDDAVALCFAGRAIAYMLCDIEAGAAFIERSLMLDPNFATAWSANGWLKTRLGQPEAAIEYLKTAMRLSPVDPLMYNMQAALAFAQLFLGRRREAAEASERILREQPEYWPAMRICAVTNALLGELDKARAAMARLRAAFPKLTVANLNEQSPLLRADYRALWANGMRAAGLPEA